MKKLLFLITVFMLAFSPHAFSQTVEERYEKGVEYSEA